MFVWSLLLSIKTTKHRMNKDHTQFRQWRQINIKKSFDARLFDLWSAHCRLPPGPWPETTLVPCSSKCNRLAKPCLMDEMFDRFHPLRFHPGLDSTMWWILVDWLSEICRECDLCHQTFHLSVTIMVHFLATAPYEKPKPFHIPLPFLQLVGIACLWLGTKLKDGIEDERLSAEYMVGFSKGLYGAKILVNMERRILQTLRHDIMFVTPFDVLVWLERHVLAGPTPSMSPNQGGLDPAFNTRTLFPRKDVDIKQTNASATRQQQAGTSIHTRRARRARFLLVLTRVSPYLAAAPPTLIGQAVFEMVYSEALWRLTRADIPGLHPISDTRTIRHLIDRSSRVLPVQMNHHDTDNNLALYQTTAPPVWLPSLLPTKTTSSLTHVGLKRQRPPMPLSNQPSSTPVKKRTKTTTPLACQQMKKKKTSLRSEDLVLARAQSRKK